MGALFVCDVCETTATSLDGWLLIHVSYQHWDPPAPGAPGNVEDGVSNLAFDKVSCRNEWCDKAGLTPPTSPTTGS